MNFQKRKNVTWNAQVLINPNSRTYFDISEHLLEVVYLSVEINVVQDVIFQAVEMRIEFPLHPGVLTNTDLVNYKIS